MAAGARVTASDLDREVIFERRHPSAGGAMRAGKDEWTPVATVRAQVRDILPSRGEKMVEGLNIASRPTRVRVRYRADLIGDMRIVHGDRVMRIVSGPAEIGRRDGMEFLAVAYSTDGTAT